MGCTGVCAKTVYKGSKHLGLRGMHTKYICAGKGIWGGKGTVLYLDCGGGYMTLGSV